ncbi:MAG: electron transfer flavoprotein subunit alpha/FixB family protein [Thermodesulfobacteriota bacterium]
MMDAERNIWVFGDYRNYFQNRVTLQLLSRAADLAPKINARVGAVILGSHINEYVNEYIAHGAQKVYLIDHPSLARYSIETYTTLIEGLARKYLPDIVLVGATSFGRELAPRLAKRLDTGLTADCIRLDINADGLLEQTAPSFGGNLLARIVTPVSRPQMATVRPGSFQEIPHDSSRQGMVICEPMPKKLPKERMRLINYERKPPRGQRIEEARVVVCGGRGMGSKNKFRKLYELAQLLGGEVGATRPVVYSGWADPEALVGQAGKQIKPQVLFSFGISGAIQHTAGFNNAGLVIAVNKNPNATMMKIADVAIVADANQFCSSLIKELKKRIRN